MANATEALKEVFELEFNNNPKKFLHKNAGEDGYTLGGIYQKANPTAIDWDMVDKLVKLVGMKRASVMLYYDEETMRRVSQVFIDNYWNPLQLHKVDSQKIANEMFVMGVVSGVTNSAKIAQRLVGVEDDGIIGNQSLLALNAFNEDRFDKEFDDREIDYFEEIVAKKPFFKRFLQGWKNRSVAV